MNTILEDKEYKFKQLEKEIYRLVCDAGVVLTQKILEMKDQKIFETVDKTQYTSKGFRTTRIRTQYGNVSYARRVYRTRPDDGKAAYVYLLDAALGMEKIGLISENLAEIIADAATGAPYREAAAVVCDATGNNISAQGAWNLMQSIGERIDDEETYDVNLMNANQ